jgi:hypothetical protein
MKRLLSLVLTFGLLVLAASSLAADDKAAKASAKEALQALQEFIGEWKGNGSPEKAKPASKELWSETLNWAWRFKGDDAWLTLDVKDGKYLKSAELRYLPDKKRYQLTARDREDKKLVFEGELKKDVLTLERTDPESKETQQIQMNTAADGVRFIYRFARKEDGRTLYKKEYLVQATRAGESLAAKESKNVCVVSGGLGTMQVSYKGETFWVCCSGCRDAFNENPEKYIAEFKAKKGKK